MTRERRYFSRIPHAFDASYRVVGELTASWCAVMSINLSAGGMRVRIDEALEKGAILEVKLQLIGIRELLIVRGCVVWNQMQASGVTEVGIEFMDVKPEQQVQIDSLVEFLKKSV